MKGMPTRAPKHRPSRLDAPRHRAEPEPPRPSATQRGYGREWARSAEAYRQQHPNCADPFGVHHVPMPGSHVDHIVPRSGGGRDGWANLQTLCASCHSRKTATYDGGFGNGRTDEPRPTPD
jgi:5-methylcytosine-specific restriction protein A